MILKLTGGPMDGAQYPLSKKNDEPSTNRKPDGLWFQAQDENGRWVKEEYEFSRTGEKGDHVTLEYIYVGQCIDLEAVIAKATAE
jgi:hypothetical protein